MSHPVIDLNVWTFWASDYDVCSFCHREEPCNIFIDTEEFKPTYRVAKWLSSCGECSKLATYIDITEKGN